MNPTIKNILAVIVGVIVMMFVNGSIINMSGSIIPLPEGVDPNDIESIKANINSYSPKHFLMPFLAHALGTFLGVFVACKIAASHKFQIAIGLGIFHLLGGIAAVFMIPGPTWFAVVDLLFAYIPMAYLAYRVATKAS